MDYKFRPEEVKKTTGNQSKLRNVAAFTGKLEAYQEREARIPDQT